MSSDKTSASYRALGDYGLASDRESRMPRGHRRAVADEYGIGSRLDRSGTKFASLGDHLRRAGHAYTSGPRAARRRRTCLMRTPVRLARLKAAVEDAAGMAEQGRSFALHYGHHRDDRCSCRTEIRLRSPRSTLHPDASAAIARRSSRDDGTFACSRTVAPPIVSSNAGFRRSRRHMQRLQPDQSKISRTLRNRLA